MELVGKISTMKNSFKEKLPLVASSRWQLLVLSERYKQLVS
jgi:hypothetical protein